MFSCFRYPSRDAAKVARRNRFFGGYLRRLPLSAWRSTASADEAYFGNAFATCAADLPPPSESFQLPTDLSDEAFSWATFAPSASKYSIQLVIISSSLLSPQRTACAGSGLAGLFGLLS